MLVGGRLATAAIGLLTVRVVTTILSPEQYGQFAILVVVQAFCGLFLVNPIGMYINRHTHEWWSDGSLLSRLKNYKWYVLVVSLIGGIAAIVVSKQIPTMEFLLIALAVILMVNGATWNSTWVPLLNMVGQRVTSVQWALITSVFTLAIPVLLCYLWPSGLTWFIGQAMGLIVGAFGARRTLLKIATHTDLNTHFPLDWRAIAAYCLPLAIGTGFMWMQLSGYRLIVEHYWGLSSLGYLSVGLMLAGQIWSLIESLAQQFLYPLFYKRIANVDRCTQSAAMSDLLNVLIPIYLLLAGAIFLAAPYLLKLLASSRYADAGIFFRLGVGVEFCRVVSNLLSSAAHTTKQTSSIVLPYAIGAIIVSSLLAIAGCMKADIWWVTICLFVTALVVLIIMWLVMFRQIKFTPDFKLWLVAGLMMVGFILPSYWLAKPTAWPEVFIFLLGISLVSSMILFFFLKKNSSLNRFMLVNLQNGVLLNDDR